MSSPSRNLLQLHGAVLLFGLAGLFGKLLHFSPVAIVCGRVVLASLTLLLVSTVWKLPVWPRSGRSFLAFAAQGALLAVHWTTFFQSVQVSSVAIALITFSTFPIFVTLLEPLFFWEKLRRGDVALAALALAGIILMPDFEPGTSTIQGILWGVSSGLTFAVLSLLNRKSVRQHSSITIALYQDAFAAIALLPFVVLHWPTLTLRDGLLVLVLGVLCTAVAHSLFIAGLHGIQARTASKITCLEPVYGSILAALLLQEIPSLRTVLSGLLVVGVAFYATIRANREKVICQDVTS